MKDVDKKDPPDVSGGYRPGPGGGGCTDPLPYPIDYPRYPGVPVPDPVWTDPIA